MYPTLLYLFPCPRFDGRYFNVHPQQHPIFLDFAPIDFFGCYIGLLELGFGDRRSLFVMEAVICRASLCGPRGTQHPQALAARCQPSLTSRKLLRRLVSLLSFHAWRAFHTDPNSELVLPRL